MTLNNSGFGIFFLIGLLSAQFGLRSNTEATYSAARLVRLCDRLLCDRGRVSFVAVGGAISCLRDGAWWWHLLRLSLIHI